MNEDDDIRERTLEADEPRWAPEVEDLLGDLDEPIVRDELIELVAAELEAPDGLAHRGSHSDLDLIIVFELGRRRARLETALGTLLLGVVSGGLTAAFVIWFLVAASGG